MKDKIVFVAVSLLAMSCAKLSEDFVDPGNDDKLLILLNVNPVSRVLEDSFEQSDEIGLFVVNNLPDKELYLFGNHVDNMKFTYSNSKWIPDNDVYWKDNETSADFYCYYPYTEEITYIDKHLFSVKSDQSAEVNYKSSEFLWGKKENIAPSNSVVSINVRHMMSKLIVYLKPGDGYSEEDLKNVDVNICNIVSDAYINLSNGVVTVQNTSKGKIIPKKLDNSYVALLVPQNIVEQQLIEVIVDNQRYTLTTSVNLESGKIYHCTVTVGKKSTGINVGIDGWETDGIDYGGTAN